MRRTFVAAALLAIAAIDLPGAVEAQESPELPADNGEPAPFFYKGKGPGRDIPTSSATKKIGAICAIRRCVF